MNKVMARFGKYMSVFMCLTLYPEYWTIINILPKTVSDFGDLCFVYWASYVHSFVFCHSIHIVLLKYF